MLKQIIKNITEKIKNSAVNYVDINLITDKSWFLVSEEDLKKIIYIFKPNGKLIISINGDVKRSNWETLIHATNSILIENDEKSELLNVVFLNSDYLILQKDGTDNFILFVKQEKYNADLSLEGELKQVEKVLEGIKDDLNAVNKPQKKRIQNIAPSEKRVKKMIDTIDLDDVILDDEVLDEVTPPSSQDIEIKYQDLSFKLSGDFLIFDLNFELDQRIERGEILTNEQEIEFILKMQQLEEEMIQEGSLCPNCRAIDSIQNKICNNCLRKT